jgi:hypothetical protein
MCLMRRARSGRPAIRAWRPEVRNLACATNAGFRAAFTARLPVEAWWRNYYDPLRERIRQLDSTVVAGQVIRETEQEIALFEKYSDY